MTTDITTVDAEAATLGAILIKPKTYTDIADIVGAADFTDARHRRIWNVITDMDAAGSAIDAITVADALDTSGELVKIGGGTYLHDLLDAVPVADNGPYYARIVAERAAANRLAAAGTRITGLAKSDLGPDRTIADLVDDATTIVQEVDTKHATITEADPGDMLTSVLHELDDAGPAPIATGYTDLDLLLAGGLRRGEVVTVAARPAMGKSIVGADIARHAAYHNGIATSLFSLEMTRAQLGRRIVAAEADVPLSSLVDRTIPETEIARFTNVMAQHTEAPLTIIDHTDIGLSDIRAHLRRHARPGRHKHLVVIDYLGIMRTDTRAENRQVEIARLMRGLKVLADEFDCAIVLLAQLNRANEGRSDKRPMLSDLRESGSIEQDSSSVVFIHRDDYYNPEIRPGEVDLIVAKNRHGRCGTAIAANLAHRGKFADMAHES